jgi:hypothetical protein
VITYQGVTLPYVYFLRLYHVYRMGLSGSTEGIQ